MSTSVNLREIDISAIKPAAYNPRKDLKPGDPEYDKLRKAILEFGLVVPLVWNERTGNLVSGHQRLKILQERGDTTVSVSVVDLDDRSEKAMNLALNKHSGEWDPALLVELVAELDAANYDIEIAGFDAEELKKLVESVENEPEVAHDNRQGSIEEQYSVLIECKDEQDQARLLEQFSEQGLKCRALIV